MLVRGDRSQACVLTTRQMTSGVSERANVGSWRVSTSLGDTHPGCKADTYCIDKVFISSQGWCLHNPTMTQRREFSPGMAIMLFSYDLAAIPLDAAVLIRRCPRLDAMFIKGLRWDHHSCLMAGTGKVLVREMLLSLVDVFWTRWAARAAARAVLKSSVFFKSFFRRFNSAIPLTLQIFWKWWREWGSNTGKLSWTVSANTYLTCLPFTNVPELRVTDENTIVSHDAAAGCHWWWMIPQKYKTVIVL